MFPRPLRAMIVEPPSPILASNAWRSGLPNGVEGILDSMLPSIVLSERSEFESGGRFNLIAPDSVSTDRPATAPLTTTLPARALKLRCADAGTYTVRAILGSPAAIRIFRVSAEVRSNRTRDESRVLSI